MPKKKITEKTGTIEVESTVFHYGQEVVGDRQNKKIEVRPFETDTATVSVKMGMTIPTQPYASVRIDVMLSTPCYVEEMEGVYNDLRTMTQMIVTEEKRRIDEWIEKKKAL